jgi:hypothetical protein
MLRYHIHYVRVLWYVHTNVSEKCIVSIVTVLYHHQQGADEFFDVAVDSWSG